MSMQFAVPSSAISLSLSLEWDVLSEWVDVGMVWSFYRRGMRRVAERVWKMAVVGEAHVLRKRRENNVTVRGVVHTKVRKRVEITRARFRVGIMGLQRGGSRIG